MRDLREKLHKAVLEAKIPLAEEQEAKLVAFFDVLARWNERMDLVAPAAMEDLLERHLIDCALAHQLLKPLGSTVLDVGSGAGFPGIPFAILSPSSKVILMEPREKRCQFLQEARRVSSLENVNVSRETLSSGSVRADLMICRALGRNHEFLTYAEQHLEAGGRAVEMAGPSGKQAEAQSLTIIPELHYRLPHSGAHRRLFVWRKSV